MRPVVYALWFVGMVIAVLALIVAVGEPDSEIPCSEYQNVAVKDVPLRCMPTPEVAR